MTELMTDHGLLPAAGGLLDQAEAFLQAARFARSELARLDDER